MGNQMFTIAGCIGIAIKSGQPYGFPRWQTHDNAIFGEPVDDIEEYLVNELPRIPTGLNFQEYGYFWGYKDINLPTGSWSIDAHMQSYKFFGHCMPLIRGVFRFKDEPEQNERIAIHIRMGDYIDDPNAQHPICTKDYYEKAIEHFGTDNKYIVFSDNKDKAYELFSSIMSTDTFFVNPECSYIEDFKLMKKCKSFIIANSSFSSFASILGEHPDKVIIAPKRWFGSSMPSEFGAEDIYSENTIVI